MKRGLSLLAATLVLVQMLVFLNIISVFSAPFDDGSYTAVDEKSGFDTTNLRVYNLETPAAAVSHEECWEEGLSGDSFRLAEGLHIRMGSNVSNPVKTGTSVTFNTFVFLDEVKPEHRLFSFYNNSSRNYISVSLAGANGLSLDISSGGTLTSVFAAGKTAMPIRIWSMVTVTLDGTSAKLYLDGQLYASLPCTVKNSDINYNNMWIGAADLFTGSNAANKTTGIKGLLDNTCLYNTALSAQEIAALYSAVSIPGEFDENGRYRLVDEQENFTSDFYTDLRDEKLTDTSAKWVEGINGKGLSLNGDEEHIRFDSDLFRGLDAMTLDIWVNWQGDATPQTSEKNTGYYWQSLFGISGPNGNLFKLMPAHNSGSDYDTDTETMEGMALEIVRNNDASNKTVLFKPVIKGQRGNELAVGKWEYVTVTMDGTNVKLYKNGELFVTAPCTYKPKDFGFDLARIGAYYTSDQFNFQLNGIVDEANVYNYALNASQIAAKYEELKPEDNGGPTVTTLFDRNGKYLVIDEPNTFKDEFYQDVQNYISTKKIDNPSSKWVNGVFGKGLRLNGEGDHVLVNSELRYEITDKLSFETWISFEGDATPESRESDSGFWWQTMFSFTGAGGNWIKGMPSHFNNDTYKSGNMILDGTAVEVQKNWHENESQSGPKYTAYKPVPEGQTNHLPTHEFSHFVFTMDGNMLKIYVNGELFATQSCSVKPFELGIDTFRIGSYFVNDNFNLPLNAILDNTALYNRILSAEEVRNAYRKPTDEGITLPERPKSFDKNGAYKIIDEPGNFKDAFFSRVVDFKGINRVNNLSSKWTAGVKGKGLKFNGKGEHVEVFADVKGEIENELSFETWICFEGDATPESSAPDTGFWWQSLAAFSGSGGNWIKAMPAHYNNDTYRSGDTILDGASVEVQKNWDSQGPKTTVFKPVKEDSGTSTALPVHKWSHYAFTLNSKTLSLYIDGQLLAQTPCSVSPKELGLDTFRVGNYFNEDKFNVPLNAILDETVLYNRTLQASEILNHYNAGLKENPTAPSLNLFDSEGRYSIIDEPENFKESIYSDGDDASKVTDHSSMWEEGINGKGLRLNGLGEHVRFNPKIFADTEEMTMSLCVKWEGDATPESEGPDTGFWWQTLVGLSGPNGNLFRIVPADFNNTDFNNPKDHTILDGASLFILRDDSDKVTVFKPTPEGNTTNALSLHGWNHVVVTMDGQTAKLYINGKLFAEADYPHKPNEFGFDLARIGLFYVTDKFTVPLNAVVDEAFILNRALDENGVAALALKYEGRLEFRAELVNDTPDDFITQFLDALDLSTYKPNIFTNRFAWWWIAGIAVLAAAALTAGFIFIVMPRIHRVKA